MRAGMTIPELLLPAGSFAAGIAAFEGGADAVYLGFSAFSARRRARNFDRLEYRRLLRLARTQGKRVYVAINTIILESELDAVSELLSWLALFPPDAIIVQDWGLAGLVRESFAAIPIHASTQTAVMTPDAARLARDLGASRVILPRETAPDTLAALKAQVPGLELELFVHGALCYSFSGLCLASGLLLGRSGNRGECAQVCRSYYDAAGPGLRGRGYWFNCRDLSLLDRLEEIARAGAASLKVEGRMKSPEYVYAVARLYRGGLDALAGRHPGVAEMRLRRDTACIAFSRSPTEAYAAHPAGSALLDAAFPGHRGLEVGVVRKTRVRRGGEEAEFLLELARPLGLRDGILAFDRGRDDKPPPPVTGSVLELRDAASGRSLVTAPAGATVLVTAGLGSNDLGALPPEGAVVCRISAREQDRRSPSPEEYPLACIELASELAVEPEGEVRGEAGSAARAGRLVLTLALPRLDGSANAGDDRVRIEDGEALLFAAAKSPGGFARALAVFAEGGDAELRLSPRLQPGATLDIPGAGRVSCADLFVPPSMLKKAKNRLYAAVQARLEMARGEAAARAAAARPAFTARANNVAGMGASAAPPRATLVFPHQELAAGLPFAMPRLLREEAALPAFGGASWLPLAPLVAHDEEYGALALARANAELARGVSLMVGISALHHVVLAQRMLAAAGELGATPRLAFFADAHLYIANRFALAVYAQRVPRLAFAYFYLESDEEERCRLTAALEAQLAVVPVGEGFEPPLFLSRACLLRHHAASGACPPRCPRRFAARLRDRERSYVALVEDCVSMLFRRPSPRPRAR